MLSIRFAAQTRLRDGKADPRFWFFDGGVGMSCNLREGVECVVGWAGLPMLPWAEERKPPTGEGSIEVAGRVAGV